MERKEKKEQEKDMKYTESQSKVKVSMRNPLSLRVSRPRLVGCDAWST